MQNKSKKDTKLISLTNLFNGPFFEKLRDKMNVSPFVHKFTQEDIERDFANPRPGLKTEIELPRLYPEREREDVEQIRNHFGLTGKLLSMGESKPDKSTPDGIPVKGYLFAD